MSNMRAKMTINNIITHNDGEVLHMNAVGKSGGYDIEDDGADENNTFAKWTPSADFQMTILNPALVGTFSIGQTFYVDFTEVTDNDS